MSADLHAGPGSAVELRSAILPLVEPALVEATARRFEPADRIALTCVEGLAPAVSAALVDALRAPPAGDVRMHGACVLASHLTAAERRATLDAFISGESPATAANITVIQRDGLGAAVAASRRQPRREWRDPQARPRTRGTIGCQAGGGWR